MEKNPCSNMEDMVREVSCGTMLHVLHPMGQESLQKHSAPLADSPKARLKIEEYALYPGLHISFHYYQAPGFYFHHHHPESLMSINHCCQGRIGWNMENGLSLYLGQGDLSLHFKDNCGESQVTLPLGFYQGISVSVDLNILKKNPPELLKEAGLDTEMLRLKFCSREKIAAFPASPRIEHIFSQLYDLPEHMKVPYMKLKCQELLLFLSMISPEETRPLDKYYSGQVEIIKEVHRLLTENLEKRYTIQQLSRKYHINTSALKNIFKSVYGLPLASYMKEYRIRQGARLLLETSESISRIAALVGYESQSKFTTAFKSIMGVLPTDYRKQYLQSETLLQATKHKV